MFVKVASAFLTTVMAVGLTASSVNAGSKHRALRAPKAASIPFQIPPPAYGFRADGRAHSPNPAHDVYVNGHYAGSDPDPLVRAKLASDPPYRHGR